MRLWAQPRGHRGARLLPPAQKSDAAAALDGTEDKEITFPAGPGKTRTLSGQDYLTGWMLPNMYFHITTAYSILRHNGVDVGKIDYLMGAGS